ncbi:tetratricopeptide repeat protein [Microbulbifer taiwanensis]|uniref:tetratricopeptide repeat protein n=1 Tax=Microbulbifer taiwanensis TaxID=986746 RepID=UPI00361C5059
MLSLSLLLASCASTPTGGGRVSDYSSVRVSGSINRDFERSLEYLREENFTAAIELLQSVVEREKRLPAPYINLGIAHYKSGDEKNAEEAFLQALEIDPQHAVATNELAVLYRKQGRFAEARKIYVNALAKNPDYLPLVKNLGILCDLYLQDLQCALAQFEQYLSLDPDDKDVAIWMADLKRRAGQ